MSEEIIGGAFSIRHIQSVILCGSKAILTRSELSFNVPHSSLGTDWLSVLGDSGSNSDGGEELSYFIFESRSYDCHLPSN